jgi:hypothetical protein
LKYVGYSYAVRIYPALIDILQRSKDIQVNHHRRFSDLQLVNIGSRTHHSQISLLFPEKLKAWSLLTELSPNITKSDELIGICSRLHPFFDAKQRITLWADDISSDSQFNNAGGSNFVRPSELQLSPKVFLEFIASSFWFSLMLTFKTVFGFKFVQDLFQKGF